MVKLSPSAQSLSKNPKELWEASHKLSLALKEVRYEDNNELKLSMSAEKYEVVDNVVGEWLVWRDMIRKLGNAAGIHPSPRTSPTVNRRSMGRDSWRKARISRHELAIGDLPLSSLFLRL